MSTPANTQRDQRPPAIDAQGLVKRFETTCAVDHVDLTVAAGEIRGLLGPNGAGKTTLLRLLFGLIAPDAGSIELFGRDLRAPSAKPVPNRLDWVAGFVETPAFYPYMSGRANLELLAELDRGAAASRIDEALKRVGLTDRAEDRVGGYSSGMLQRLGIAAALLRAPQLLLLDEPTAGLDPAGVRDVRLLVQELSAEGVAVLLSSHQIDEVEEVCDSFTVLRAGKVVWDGTAHELRAQAPASAYRLMTSDNERASELARAHPRLEVERAAPGTLSIAADDRALEEYVLALAAEGIAVRRLELPTGPLEAMFFRLTGEEALQPA
jgi:ABC-2 type transport system ATP-binding protein